MKLKLLVAALAVILSASVASAEETTAYYVNAKSVNMRSQASVTSAKLGRLSKFDLATSSHEKLADDWVPVTADIDGMSRNGFVKEQYLTRLTPGSFPESLFENEFELASGEDGSVAGNMIFDRNGNKFTATISYYNMEARAAGGSGYMGGPEIQGTYSNGKLTVSGGAENTFVLYDAENGLLVLDGMIWKAVKY